MQPMHKFSFNLHLVRFSAVVSIFCLTSIAYAGAADIELLISRLQSGYQEATDTSSAASYLSTIQGDGCYGDIDYTDQGKSRWQPADHLLRLRVLAAAYKQQGHPLFQDIATLASLRRGLDCWYRQAPASTNWWHNEIGKQRSLGTIGVLLEDHLSLPRKQNIINDLQTGVSSRRKGQNRVWIAQNMVLRGCLERNPKLIDIGLEAIKGTVVIGQAEGIQRDYSFFQHGPMLYNAGYGQSFVTNISRWIHSTHNTRFAFSDSAVDIIVRFLLDGNRWMIRGRMFDYSADGREVARPGQSASALVDAARRLADVVPARAPELEALAAHIEGTAAPPVTGNRYFYRGELMTHQRPGYYASVKLASNRTYGTECLNQENLLGNWLPFGLTYIVQSGDEYRDIFPLWDWNHLPGVTNPAVTSCPETSFARSSFAGGVSDGHHGVAAMTLEVEKTGGKKAWFFFDKELVALGADISSTHTAGVSTTLNQTWLQSSAVVVDGVKRGKGKHIEKNAGWVFHDSVGYLLLQKGDLVVFNQKVNGSWQNINTSGSKAAVSGNVFALWIDHGKGPRDAKYAYAVVPGTSQGDFVAGYTVTQPFIILENSGDVQAVLHNDEKLLGVVFHRAGSLSCGQVVVTADKACLLLLDLSDPKTVTIHASNPYGSLTNLTLSLHRGGPEEPRIIELQGVDAKSKRTVVATHGAE